MPVSEVRPNKVSEKNQRYISRVKNVWSVFWICRLSTFTTPENVHRFFFFFYPGSSPATGLVPAMSQIAALLPAERRSVSRIQPQLDGRGRAAGLVLGPRDNHQQQKLRPPVNPRDSLSLSFCTRPNHVTKATSHFSPTPDVCEFVNAKHRARWHDWHVDNFARFPFVSFFSLAAHVRRSHDSIRCVGNTRMNHFARWLLSHRQGLSIRASGPSAKTNARVSQLSGGFYAIITSLPYPACDRVRVGVCHKNEHIAAARVTFISQRIVAAILQYHQRR